MPRLMAIETQPQLDMSILFSFGHLRFSWSILWILPFPLIISLSKKLLCILCGCIPYWFLGVITIRAWNLLILCVFNTFINSPICSMPLVSLFLIQIVPVLTTFMITSSICFLLCLKQRNLNNFSLINNFFPGTYLFMVMSLI